MNDYLKDLEAVHDVKNVLIEGYIERIEELTKENQNLQLSMECLLDTFTHKYMQLLKQEKKELLECLEDTNNILHENGGFSKWACELLKKHKK